MYYILMHVMNDTILFDDITPKLIQSISRAPMTNETQFEIIEMMENIRHVVSSDAATTSSLIIL